MNETTEILIEKFNKKDQAGFIKVLMTVRAEMELTEEEYPQTHILRFYLHFNQDTKLTLDAIKNNIEWKKEFPFDEAAKLNAFEFIEMQERLGMFFYGCDRLGRPIRFSRITSLDPQVVMDAFTYEEFHWHNVAYIERVVNIIFPMCSDKYKHPVYQTITILDLSEAHINKYILNKKVMDYIKKQSEPFVKNYPDISSKVFIINAGVLVKALFSFFSYFLEKRVLDRVKVYNKGYMEELTKYVDKKDLPMCIGGENETEPKDYINFWDEQERQSIKDKRLK